MSLSTHTVSLETYGKVAANMMKQNDIPAFLDYKRSVASNPYVEMLCSALEIVEKGYPYDTMFRYLRTGLTGTLVNADIFRCTGVHTALIAEQVSFKIC